MILGWDIPEVGSVLPECGAPEVSAQRDSLSAYRSALDLLEVPVPGEPGQLMRWEAGVLLDHLGVRIARGRGALDHAIGLKLGELLDVSGELELGYSQAVDLARELLGLTPAFVRRLVRFEAALRTRPVLREAVFSGSLSRRKAEVILRRATGDAEAAWVELAKKLTVRKLELAVKRDDPGAPGQPAGAAPGATPAAETDPEPDEQPWRHLRQWLGAKTAPVVQAALELARYLDEAPRTLPERLRFMAMEYLSGHPAPEVPAGQKPRPEFLGQPYELTLDERAWFERESREWSFLFSPLPVPTPRLERTSPPDPYTLLDELRVLVRIRNAWDEELGRVLVRMQAARVWRALGFAGFHQYVEERLGLSPSNLKQRVALERKLMELPPLREALRSGKLSYEQARHVSKDATVFDVKARIEEAAGKTCLELQRAVEEKRESQMWNARFLDLPIPEDVDRLLADAVRAARAAAGHWLSPPDALLAIAKHVISVWKPMVEEKLKKAHPVAVRDGGMCKVAGCSRVGDEVHHIKFRSQGGSDDPDNEVLLCKPHHHRGIHAGNLWVWGKAPDGLTWVLGWREVEAAKRAGKKAA